MDVTSMIEANNEKRKELTKENLHQYEEMLVYLRLSFSSEQATEEVLSELLDHLLAAQADGKTAHDIFGDDPKQYANHIVGALPRMVSKERLQYFMMAVLYFFSTGLVFTGIANIVFYYVFKGNFIKTLTAVHYLGTVGVNTLLLIPLAFVLLFLALYIIRWMCFKQINKFISFLIYWFYGIVSIGVFLVLFYFMPSFGPVVTVPYYLYIVVGIVLFGIAHFVKKAI